jgi:triphosphatase
MDAAASMPVELELKFAVPPEALALVADHDLLALPADAERLRATYYDTEDDALARAGMSLRVRRNGERWTQTLKTAAGPDGPALARGEWEWALADGVLDRGLLGFTPAGPLLAERALHAVLHSEIARRSRLVELPGGTVIEAAVDEGMILAGERREAVSELELELKSGPVGPLYQHALRLHEAFGLVIGAESKAARGWRLRTGRAPEVVKLPDLALAPGTTVAAGLRAMIGYGIAGLIGNQPAALAGEAEGVHQMRVSLRRLRTCLVLFAPHLPASAIARFNSALAGLGRVLGAARDWDVLCTETLPRSFGEGERQASGALMAQGAEMRRSAAHDALRATLASAGPSGLILSLAAWSYEPGLPEAVGEATLIATVPALLDRLARKVNRRGRHAGKLDPEELHDLRKALKKLRYAVDFAAALYPPKAVNAYLKRCKHLQEVLGQINDVAAAISLGEDLADADIERAAPLAILAAEATSRGANARRKLAPAVKALARVEAFW